MGIAEIRLSFPKLKTSKSIVTSPATGSYNCIAWAAGDDERWWWPDPMEQHYWPELAPREPTEEAFIEAFGLLGYKSCKSPALEPDLEKIALYSLGSVPKHAARQLRNGLWTSKLGRMEDITHRLQELEGELYGDVYQVLARPRPVTGKRLAKNQSLRGRRSSP